VTEYQEPPTLMKLEIEGEWTETNSKGISRLQTQEYQSFMKNPGYILPILKTTTMRFRLQSLDYMKQYNEILENGLENALSLEPPSMSIAVFQLLDNFKFKSILSDENYVPAAWGFYSRYFFLIVEIDS